MTNGPAIIEALDKSSKSPSGLAFDPRASTLFSAYNNDPMAVVDADSGKVIATPSQPCDQLQPGQRKMKISVVLQFQLRKFSSEFP